MEKLNLDISADVSAVLLRVIGFLSEKGVRSYLTGGFVRDMLLGRDTADIDIAVARDALETGQEIAAALDGKYVLLDRENGVARVVLEDPSGSGRWMIDLSTLRGDAVEDMSRRDFTINAMAVNVDSLRPMLEEPGGVALAPEEIIDPFGGQGDLERRLIRAVSPSVFPSDAVRLLRAVRLAGELDFTIEEETSVMIERCCQLITGVAGERVREELLRILAVPGGHLIVLMDKLGLLTAVFPELAPARGVDQPVVHFWDVYRHSIETVAAVDFLLRRGGWEYGGEEALAPVPWSEALERHFEQDTGGATGRVLLKLAALLHDIAKPQTKRAVEEGGRVRFLGHATEGAAVVAGILEKLRFSTREIKRVSLIIENHLRPSQMSSDGLPTRRAIYRFFRDTGDAGIDLLYLNLADHLAARGPNLDWQGWLEHCRTAAYVLEQHFSQEAAAAPPKLVDGHELMNAFGLGPGPRLGELLEAVREAQAAGEVTTREAALEYVAALLSAVNKSS
ncbi:MAG: CCA tRNA nucleotidyltransferase [Chloroflexi bacterium]|nr:CCA tRNA nucleotidyltransferase [Chloroflexota bacterium]